MQKNITFYIQQYGIHPSEIADTKEKIDEDVKKIEEIANIPDSKVVAIGEIGLDYHMGTDTKESQKYAFLEQIKLANKLDLPIIIHSRDAIMDTIDILKHEIKPQKKGILHCCQLNKDLVKARP